VFAIKQNFANCILLNPPFCEFLKNMFTALNSSFGDGIREEDQS